MTTYKALTQRDFTEQAAELLRSLNNGQEVSKQYNKVTAALFNTYQKAYDQALIDMVGYRGD